MTLEKLGDRIAPHLALVHRFVWPSPDEPNRPHHVVAEHTAFDGLVPTAGRVPRALFGQSYVERFWVPSDVFAAMAVLDLPPYPVALQGREVTLRHWSRKAWSWLEVDAGRDLRFAVGHAALQDGLAVLVWPLDDETTALNLLKAQKSKKAQQTHTQRFEGPHAPWHVGATGDRLPEHPPPMEDAPSLREAVEALARAADVPPPPEDAESFALGALQVRAYRDMVVPPASWEELHD